MPLPIPTLDSSFSNSFIAHQWDFSAMWNDVLTWYGNSIGLNGTIIISCILLLVVAGAIWLRTEDIILPSMIVSIICGTLYFNNLIPLPWQGYIVIIFGVFAVFAIAYHIIHER